MEQQLEHKRHTLAHLLAAAVVEQYPHAKLTLGPAIDNGFYYDIDFSAGEAPGEDDLSSGHARHESMDVLPMSGEYNPAPHLLHDCCPSKSWY